MKVIVVALLGLSVLASGCGTQTASPPAKTHAPSLTAPGSSPMPTTSQVQITPLAVIISGLDTYPTPPSYTVSLVDLTGKTIRAATAANRSWSEIHFTDDGYGHPTSLLQVSPSNNRVYYLDGESAVRFVALSGSARLAHTPPAGTHVE